MRTSKSPARTCLARARRAFTLVEILVVLAVVLLLAALLFPIFSRVRENARTLSCANNLRQIHLGMQLYVSDANGYYPCPGAAKPNCSWVDSLVFYTRSEAVFVCPQEPLESYKPGCGASETINSRTFGFNGGYLLNAPSIASTVPIPQRNVRLPDRFLLLVDSTSIEGQSNAIGTSKEPLSRETLKGMSLDFRHSDALNVLFADGHVKKRSPEAVSSTALWRLNGLA